MTTPPGADGMKSAKFTPEVHAELMAVARQINGTMDDAIRYLLGMSVLRVPITPGQRARWAEAARKVGVPLDQFVAMRIEACLQFGTDGVAIMRIFDMVTELSRKAQETQP